MRTNNKLNGTLSDAESENRTRPTLVEGEYFHHCAITYTLHDHTCQSSDWFFSVFGISAWSLKCYHCEYGTVWQCDPERGNKSSVLECTETNTQCFKQKISEVDSEDKLRQGCTNEEGCTIRKNSCAGSGDCTATCCGKDLCNHGTSGASNKGRVLIFLAIAIISGYHLCMWCFFIT